MGASAAALVCWRAVSGAALVYSLLIIAAAAEQVNHLRRLLRLQLHERRLLRLRLCLRLRLQLRLKRILRRHGRLLRLLLVGRLCRHRRIGLLRRRVQGMLLLRPQVVDHLGSHGCALGGGQTRLVGVCLRELREDSGSG